METLADPQIWIGLLTLTALEIVLGIDNIVFISILAGRLPEQQAGRARVLGLGFALVTRLALLASLAWIIRLTAPLFTVFGNEISGRDLILLIGGIFLLAKATREIHERLEGPQGHAEAEAVPSFAGVILQIGLLDMIFSLDSVITAVGMVRELWVMITAVVIAIAIMMLSAETISDFVNRHPTVKMLALSFLLLIGMTLVAEGVDFHIPKGYIYFAMGFSILVEFFNLRSRSREQPVQLHQPYVKDREGAV